MNNKKVILYGVSDFVDLRCSNGYFIDRTNLIPALETTRYIMFLRPRRFGKSLLIAMLHSYYDKAMADRFDELFRGTSIHEHPTSEHNSYLVLTLNFSAIMKDSQQAQDDFNAYCMSWIDAFVDKNSALLPSAAVAAVHRAGSCHAKLNALHVTLSGTGVKIYVMIDEYDNFTNTILSSEGLDAYNRLCHGEGFFKQFFCELKAATTGNDCPIKRIFITGVSPVTLDDVTSGFNIARNISMEPAFADLLGFHENEVRDMLDYYTATGDFKLDVESTLDIMRDWYNNYSFSPDCPLKVFNPTLVLGFLCNAFYRTSVPNILYDENLRTDYTKLQHLVTLNNRLNGNFHAIEQILADGGCTMEIARSFQACDMVKPQNFVSLLYYFGMLSCHGIFHGVSHLVIPNLTMNFFLNSFIMEGYAHACHINTRTSELTLALSNLAYEGSWRPCMELVADIIHDCFASRDGIEGEKVIQADMTAIMTIAANPFIISSEYHAANGYADISLAPFLTKYPDMRYAMLIELKYLKAKDDCTPQILARLKAEAAEQLTRYAADKALASLWQLMSAGGTIHLIRLAVVFQGGNMRLCEAV